MGARRGDDGKASQMYRLLRVLAGLFFGVFIFFWVAAAVVQLVHLTTTQGVRGFLLGTILATFAGFTIPFVTGQMIWFALWAVPGALAWLFDAMSNKAKPQTP